MKWVTETIYLQRMIMKNEEELIGECWDGWKDRLMDGWTNEWCFGSFIFVEIETIKVNYEKQKKILSVLCFRTIWIHPYLLFFM